MAVIAHSQSTESQRVSSRSGRRIGIILALLVVYVGIALSSLPDELGRSNPAIASFLRPPFVNFYADYSSGEVLGLRIGMTRSDSQRFVERRFAGVATLNANCAGDGVLPGNQVDVPLQDQLRVDYLFSKDAVCLLSSTSGLVLILNFSMNQLRSVELSYIRIGK